MYHLKLLKMENSTKKKIYLLQLFCSKHICLKQKVYTNYFDKCVKYSISKLFVKRKISFNCSDVLHGKFLNCDGSYNQQKRNFISWLNSCSFETLELFTNYSFVFNNYECEKIIRNISSNKKAISFIEKYWYNNECKTTNFNYTLHIINGLSLNPHIRAFYFWKSYIEKNPEYFREYMLINLLKTHTNIYEVIEFVISYKNNYHDFYNEIFYPIFSSENPRIISNIIDQEIPKFKVPIVVFIKLLKNPKITALNLVLKKLLFNPIHEKVFLEAILDVYNPELYEKLLLEYFSEKVNHIDILCKTFNHTMMPLLEKSYSKNLRLKWNLLFSKEENFSILWPWIKENKIYKHFGFNWSHIFRCTNKLDDVILQHVSDFDIVSLCMNKNKNIGEFVFQQYFDKMNNDTLFLYCENTSAVDILRKHQKEFKIRMKERFLEAISGNRHAFIFLEEFPNNPWIDNLCSNQNGYNLVCNQYHKMRFKLYLNKNAFWFIFDYNYSFLRERIKLIKKELIKSIMKPERLIYIVNKYHIDFNEYMESVLFHVNQ